MYILKAVIFISIFFTTSCLHNSSARPANQQQVPEVVMTPSRSDWKPAIFKGLAVGVSFRKEAIKILGKPSSTSTSKNDLPKHSGTAEIVDEYDFSEDIKGKLIISSSQSTGVLSSIVIYPTELDFQVLASKYGKDYRVVKYKFVVCPNDAGSSAIEESESGDIEFVEYRSQGVVVDVNTADQKVKSIEFVSGPIGVTNFRCK